MQKIQKILRRSSTAVAIVERDGKIEERHFPVTMGDAEIEAAASKPSPAKKGAKKSKKEPEKTAEKEPTDAEAREG